MATLSISAAWNEAAAFVKREARLLFPVAFLLVALPAGILRLLMPAAAPGQTPEAGAWLLFMPVAVVLGMVGTLALTALALRSGVSVGEALQLGARRFPVLLGASLLLGLGAILLMVPLLVLVGGVAAAGGGGGAAAGSLLLAMTLLFAVALALWVRLMPMTPVTAAEPGGPIAVLRRSWGLTRGHFWKLLGFILLVLLVFAVVSAVAAILGGTLIVLLAGQPHPGTLSAFLLTLIGVVVNMVVTVYFTALNARIYRQLSGSDVQDAFL